MLVEDYLLERELLLVLNGTRVEVGRVLKSGKLLDDALVVLEGGLLLDARVHLFFNTFYL